MKKLDFNLEKEYQPSPKLKIIYKYYILISILIGLFSWLMPYIIMNFNGLDTFTYLSSLLLLFIVPLFAICAISPLIINQSSNSPIILPFFTFAVLPSLIILISHMFLLLLSPITYSPYSMTSNPVQVILPMVLVLIELSISYIFISSWIPKFCDSISFQFTESEIIVNKGIWFRNTTIVPYKRIINISIKQGPLFRNFELGTLEIYTAKHSNITKPEIKMEGIENFQQIREFLMEKMKNGK